MTHKYTIAAFDFDDTLTRKCTFVDIFIFARGWFAFLSGMFFLLPDVLAYYTGNLSNYDIKKKMFTKFFAGMDKEKYNEICNTYSLNVVDKLISNKAREKLNWHKQQNHTLVIITASFSEWITPWALKNGFNKVIASSPEVIEGLLTGDFESKNCFGEEKVRRLLEAFPARDDYFLYYYGDSEGDKELLAYADVPILRFKEQLNLS